MTIRDELQSLYRLFPNSEDLAISAEMAQRYEAECATLLRLIKGRDYVPWTQTIETYPTIVATSFPMMFKDRHLVVVTPRS